MQNTIQAKTMINVRIKSRFNGFSKNLQCIVLSKITQLISKIHTET